MELLRATYSSHTFARHTHDEFMVGVIERGGCAFYYRGGTHVAAAGSIVLINPGEAHDGSDAEAASLTYRALYPDVALLQRRVRTGGKAARYSHRCGADQPHLRGLYAQDGGAASGPASLPGAGALWEKGDGEQTNGKPTVAQVAMQGRWQRQRGKEGRQKLAEDLWRCLLPGSARGVLVVVMVMVGRVKWAQKDGWLEGDKLRSCWHDGSA